MKVSSLSLIVCILVNAVMTNSQNSRSYAVKNKKEVVYLSLEKGALTITEDVNAADSRTRVNAKANAVNLYIKWLNPLKYRITWKDTIMADPRDKAISDFLIALANQFGPAVTNLNKEDEAKAAKNTFEQIKEKVNFAVPNGTIAVRNFSDLDLLHMLLAVRTHTLSNDEIISFNALTKQLRFLDSLSAQDYKNFVNSSFTSMVAFTSPSQVSTSLAAIQSSVNAINDSETGLGKIEAMEKEVLATANAFSLPNDFILQTYIRGIITGFVNEVSAKRKADEYMIAKMLPIMALLKESVQNLSANSNFSDHAYVRSIEFENGKIVKTTVTVTEYEFKADVQDFVKVKEVTSQQMIFERFDRVRISVSSGIFYSNTTLKSFGIGQNENNQFIVKEDNINKDNAVTAVFLNFNFGDSRYFTPLFQLGIDPTKRRPFLLAGIGLSFSLNETQKRIALSFGPIWTWDQALETLKIGGVVQSTTDVEKDIKYRFKSMPVGGYLGVQYSF